MYTSGIISSQGYGSRRDYSRPPREIIYREHRHRQRQVLEHCSFKSLGDEEPGTRDKKVKKVSYRSNQVDTAVASSFRYINEYEDG